MNIKFYIDPDLKVPHILKHDVSENEILVFFNETDYFTKERDDGSFEAIGKLPNGRYLIVAYRIEKNGATFVITAYDIEDKELIYLLEDFYDNN